MSNLVIKDLKNILYIRYMKSKFKVGDKVVISPKYRNKYNCITTVGTVTKVDFNGFRCVYAIKFEGKKLEKYFYSYELEVAPKEKIETRSGGASEKNELKNKLKNKLIQMVYFRPQDEVEKPLFKVGDKVFLTSQAIQWLKEHDSYQAINPKDYYKQFEITQVHSIYREKRWRVCYILDNQRLVYFLNEDLIRTRQTPAQTNIGFNSLDRLKKSWVQICNIYLSEFCRRHNFSYDRDMWISGNPGTAAEVCDMIISMDDIRYDVDNQIDPNVFQKWYWKSVEVSELTNGTQSYLNYPSFCKGAPDPFTKERMEQLRKAHQRVLEAKEALRLEIEAFKSNKKLF